MRLTFATSPSPKHIRLLEQCKVEHILISYAFIKNVDRLLKLLGDYRPKSLILDSGAFSVWANGQTIDIRAYTRFAKELKEKLPKEIELNVVNLDVLPGKFGQTPTNEEREQSAIDGWENMLKLESEGLKVIPVYHQHEDLKWLDKMRQHTDYIGISPANDVSMPQKLAFMDSVFAKIKGTIKTHGFAVTSPEQLYRYPFYSADSTTWVSAGRFGYIPVFTEDFKLKTCVIKNKKHILKYWSYISHLGIDKISEGWESATVLSVKSFQELERIATKLWTSRGIVWN